MYFRETFAHLNRPGFTGASILSGSGVSGKPRALQDNYSEKDWQKLIVDFLLLIIPKYIAVIEECPVKDFYSNPLKPTNRRIDMALVGANGAIDIVEIKKPATKQPT